MIRNGSALVVNGQPITGGLIKQRVGSMHPASHCRESKCKLSDLHGQYGIPDGAHSDEYNKINQKFPNSTSKGSPQYSHRPLQLRLR